MSEIKARPLGGTEFSWTQAVPGGTGITVLALLLPQPPNLSFLENTLHKLQNSHSILRSRLLHPTSPSPSFSISPSPFIQIQSIDLPTTSNLLQTLSPQNHLQISPFHLLLEHELNQNPWSQTQNPSEIDLFFATHYSLPDSNHVLALRLHTSICDRSSAVALLRELLGLFREREGGAKWEFGGEGGEEVPLPIEEIVPKGKGDKWFWARGADLVGYSLNSLRLSNLGFEEVGSNRRSEVVRLQISRDETQRLLAVSV